MSAQVSALNDSTVTTIATLQERASPGQVATEERQIQQRANRTFTGIGVMTWGAFVLGLVIIVTSLVLFVVQGKSLNVLGMGTIGLGDIVAILLYRPMDRLQEADAMYAQQTILLRGWAMTINLELLAMDTSNRDSIRQTATDIQSATEEYGKILGQLLSTGSGAASPSTTTGPQGSTGGTGASASKASGAPSGSGQG